MKDAKFKSREIFMLESLNEFCEYSYENASLNRIIKNSGASKGSFYYHFKNKEDLYQKLLEESVGAKWAFINQFTLSENLDFEKMDLFEKFLFQAKAGMTFAQREPRYAKLSNMFAKEKGSPIYEKMRHLIGGDATDMLGKMISEAYEKGELDRSYDLSFVVRIIEKLFSNYDDFFSVEESLERNLIQLNEFVRFMKSGFGR